MSLIYSFYILCLFIIFKRNFNIWAYVFIFWLLTTFIFSNVFDFCFWKLYYNTNLELYINQLLQYFYRLDMNWLFMYYLFIAYLLFHNKHIFLLYLYVAIVCFYCFDFNFEFSNIVFFEFFKVNEKLINGWFMIHPFLTYFFYAIFLVIIYIIHIYYKLAIFKDIFMLLFYKYIFSYIMRVIVYICILIGCVALILGGWWAQQEISWNGWWGWDFVEIVNLSLFFFVLLIVHIETLNTFSYINKIYMQKLLLIFLLFTVCLRYNIFSSLHTFLGLSIIAQIYWYVLLIIFILVLFINLYNFKANYISNKYYLISVKNISCLIFSSLNCVIMSFLFFVFYFSENFFFLRELFYYLFCFYYLFFFSKKFYIALVIFLLIFVFFDAIALYCFLLSLFFVKFKRFLFFHVLFYTYFVIFLTRDFSVDFFSINYDYYYINYIYNIKLVAGTFFYMFLDKYSNFTNYARDILFYSIANNSFFTDNNYLFKNSSYVAFNGFLCSNLFFELFDISLHFDFIDKLYDLVLFLFLYVFLQLKRKKNDVYIRI